MSRPLQWETDGRDWPHRAQSRFVQAAGLRWHIQQFGQSSGEDPDMPVALLLHGTGASTHSWRGLAPLLAPHFKVLTLDLPGHAFTDMPSGGSSSQQMSLPGMARAVGGLLAVLDVNPTLMIGHSAGAALAVRMALDGLVLPDQLEHIVSINGALQPLGGLAGQVFSPVAKLMSALPFVPELFAWQATHAKVLQKLMDSTGSKLDAQGMALYGQLVSNPGHAAGALSMMANWDLPSLAADLPRLVTPLSLIVASEDRTIPPRQATQVMNQLAQSSAKATPQLVVLPGLGHLAHEERPDIVAMHILQQTNKKRY
jgi:magnesium chelatase accessory protein